MMDPELPPEKNDFNTLDWIKMIKSLNSSDALARYFCLAIKRGDKKVTQVNSDVLSKPCQDLR